MSKLPTWIRRGLAIGLLCVTLAGIWSFTLLPLQSQLDETTATIAASEELVARYRQITARRGAIEAQGEELDRQLTENSPFLDGVNASLVAAALQNQIKSVVAKHGSSLKSVQTLPVGHGEAFPRVGLRVTMTSDTVGMQAIFHSLENMRPFLFLDGIDVRSATLQRRPKDGRGDDGLTVRFDLFGFLRDEAT